MSGGLPDEPDAPGPRTRIWRFVVEGSEDSGRNADLIDWIRDAWIPSGDPTTGVTVAEMYDAYADEFPHASDEPQRSRCQFGKCVHKAFPGVRMRRLGPADDQRHCYMGLRRKLGHRGGGRGGLKRRREDGSEPGRKRIRRKEGDGEERGTGEWRTAELPRGRTPMMVTPYIVY